MLQNSHSVHHSQFLNLLPSAINCGWNSAVLISPRLELRRARFTAPQAPLSLRLEDHRLRLTSVAADPPSCSPSSVVSPSSSIALSFVINAAKPITGKMANEEVKHLEDCSVSNALGTWVFSVAGALLAIPVGIKRKSLAPLVFFGTTGTMLDIIMGISACEREHAERQMKLIEAQRAATDTSLVEANTDS
ncbi:hypothetical protein S245_032580 [Arachis hypogaea]